MKIKIIEDYKEEPRQIFNRNLGVLFNGYHNLGPTIIENLIDRSPTAQQCCGVYESYLRGDGFLDDKIKHLKISDNHLSYSPDHLLSEIVESCARHSGAFVHVNYNAHFKKTSFQVLNYSRCRLGEPDSKEFSGKIVYSPKGFGRELEKDKLDVIDVYNPNPQIIEKQVEKAVGWENYKGQVYYFKFSSKYIYARPLISAAYKYADVENQLGEYYNNHVRRGFVDVKLVRHRQFKDNEAKQEFFNSLKEVSGAKGTSGIVGIEDDWDDEGKSPGNIRIEDLTSVGNAEKFAHVEASSANFIRKAYKNIPPQLIDYVQGKLGNTSGEDLRKAVAMYNDTTTSDRNAISELFCELFRGFHVDVQSDWRIKQHEINI